MFPVSFVKARPPGVMYNCNLIKLWISPITGYTKTGHDIEQSPLSSTFIAREFCCSDTSGAVKGEHSKLWVQTIVLLYQISAG